MQKELIYRLGIKTQITITASKNLNKTERLAPLLLLKQAVLGLKMAAARTFDLILSKLACLASAVGLIASYLD